MTLARSVAFVAACGLGATSTASAQSAAAEALFREGRALIKQGNVEAGCAKLAASDKLESSVGTLLNLGDCREKLGKSASAWAAFRKAEAMAKRAGDDPKRQAEARRRAERLEPDLASLVIQVGKSTPGIMIKRGDETLDPAVLDSPLPVDPGTHTIVAEAPGHKPFTTKVSLGKGGRRYVVIPTLERVPEPVVRRPPPPRAPVTTTPAPVITSPPVETTVVVERARERGTWTATRKVAVSIAVVGVAALGTGLYFGQRANNLQDRSDAICPEITCGDPEGLRLNDDAQDHARRANILFVASGGALVAATVMWVVGGPGERTAVAPTVGGGQVGASFVGRF